MKGRKEWQKRKRNKEGKGWEGREGNAMTHSHVGVEEVKSKVRWALDPKGMKGRIYLQLTLSNHMITQD